MAQPDGFVPVGVEDKQPQVAVSITQPQPQPPEQPKPEEKQSEQAVAQQPVAQPETKANQPSEPQANGKSSKKLKKKRKPIRPAPAERVSSDIGPIPHLQITIIAPTPKASSGPGKAVKEQKSPRKQESKDAGALKPAAQAADTPARRLSQSRAAEPAQPPSLGVACGIRSAAIMSKHFAWRSASFHQTLLFWSLLIFLWLLFAVVVTNFAMFICNIVAVSKRGGLSEEDVNCNRSPSCGYPPRIGLTEQLSVTEVVLTIVSLITLLLNCARLRQTLFGIQMGNKPSWQWHHTETIRTMLMLLFASVWFYPAVVNFLFHSLGTNFSDLERDANAKLRDYLTFHIVAFVLVVLTSLLSAWFIQKLLHVGSVVRCCMVSRSSLCCPCQIVRGEGEQKITAGLLTAGRLSIVLALLAQAAFVIA